MSSFYAAALVTLPFFSSAADMPTVSIIMPTYGRPEFSRRALEQIFSQDYPKDLIAEVVIVDDSPTELRLTDEDFNGYGVKVEYVVLEEKQSVGAKRNEAVRHLTGSIVVHWDDDDIYDQRRLRASVEPISSGKANVTVLSHSFTYFMDRDELYESAGHSWGPHFGSLAWRSSLFNEANGVLFPDTSAAEDYAFAQRAVEIAGATIEVVDSRPGSSVEPPLFIASRHGTNTWEWSSALENRKFTGSEGGKRLPSLLLDVETRRFAQDARSSKLFDTLRERRRASGGSPKKKAIDPSVNPQFFDVLYASGPGVFTKPTIKSLALIPGNAVNANERHLVGRAAQPRLNVITYFDWDGVDDDNWEYQVDYYDACCEECSSDEQCQDECFDQVTASYDLVTEMAWSETGGIVGLEPTSLADHGGRFTVDSSLVLENDLVLVYYTCLIVKGDLDGNGHNVSLSAFASLVVEGSLESVIILNVGRFGTVSVTGSMQAIELLLVGGGTCVLPWCDPSFFDEAADSYASATSVGGAFIVSGFVSTGCCIGAQFGGDATVQVFDVDLSQKDFSSLIFEGNVDLKSGNMYLYNTDVIINGTSVVLQGSLTLTGVSSFMATDALVMVASLGFDFWHSGSAVLNHVTTSSVSFYEADGCFTVLGNATCEVLSDQAINSGVTECARSVGSFLQTGSASISFSTWNVESGAVISGDAYFAFGAGFNVINGAMEAELISSSGSGIGLMATSVKADSILISGSLSTDDCVTNSLTVGYLQGYSKLSVSGNLSVTGVASISKSSDVVVGQASIDSLEVDSACSFTVTNSEGLKVHDLRLNSAAYLETGSSPTKVNGLLELAPHFYSKCPGDLDFVAAGNYYNKSDAICNATGSGWDSHVPIEDCQISDHTCDAASNPSDYASDWLLNDFVLQHPGCFIGPNGDDFASSTYDRSQSCS